METYNFINNLNSSLINMNNFIDNHVDLVYILQVKINELQDKINLIIEMFQQHGKINDFINEYI